MPPLLSRRQGVRTAEQLLIDLIRFNNLLSALNLLGGFVGLADAATRQLLELERLLNVLIQQVDSASEYEAQETLVALDASSRGAGAALLLGPAPCSR